ncbi:pilus assembly protein [Bradyrhizobium sp. CB1650]|uniref:TadE/TadG family type IV pilus assembly protein n=1 Tax=Bradyrhizobium sp. CB1650 TaxID=3039153 RepID=UPI0024356B8D|nr:pilus assembly protein [Bradyrhizobium sp. CB1650]WGD51883.1 pilus assembly protein [Bradyrhizobium sp. CB1650]
MPSPAPSKFTLRTALRRFRGNRRGSAAVEFALVAPWFFALLFAIIETALMFFASQVLETIAQNSARIVLTGQAQSGSVALCAVNSVSTPCTQATFKNYVCSQIPALFDCNSLYVDVQSYPNSFASVTLSNHMDASCNFDSSGMQYSPGTSSQVVVVRLFYQWPLFVTGLGYNIGCGASNKRLLVATAAFQNEPF